MRERASPMLRRQSRPRMRARPALGFRKPSNVRISVDLPAPLGPSSPTALPVPETPRRQVIPWRISRRPSLTFRSSSSTTGVIFNRGASPLGLPYTLARGDPSAPLPSRGSLAALVRDQAVTGGLRPSDSPTRSLAGTPPPRSPRVAHSLRSFATRPSLAGVAPRTPLHARSRGPLRPAPLAWLT